MLVMPGGAPPAYLLPNLGAIRLRRAFSQDALSKEARVGRITISRIESGHPARIGTIRKLAAALGVEPHELMRPNPD